MLRMINFMKAYFKVTAKNTLVYRGMLFLWIIGWLLSFLTMVFLWLSAEIKGSDLAGFSQNQIVTYYFLGLLVWSVSGWYAFSWVAKEIKDGTIVNFLTKPINYFWRIFASELSWHVVNTIFYLFFLVIIYFLTRNYLVLQIKLERGLLFLLSLVIAALVTFEFNMVMATAAFWLTEYSGLGSMFWFLYNLFGGQIIPLAFFPGWSQLLVKLLPFRFMYSFPIEIYLGKLIGWELIWSFTAGIFWIVSLHKLYKFLWLRGLKKYTAFGQ